MTTLRERFNTFIEATESLVGQVSTHWAARWIAPLVFLSVGGVFTERLSDVTDPTRQGGVSWQEAITLAALGLIVILLYLLATLASGDAARARRRTAEHEALLKKLQALGGHRGVERVEEVLAAIEPLGGLEWLEHNKEALKLVNEQGGPAVVHRRLGDGRKRAELHVERMRIQLDLEPRLSEFTPSSSQQWAGLIQAILCAEFGSVLLRDARTRQIAFGYDDPAAWNVAVYLAEQPFDGGSPWPALDLFWRCTPADYEVKNRALPSHFQFSMMSRNNVQIARDASQDARARDATFIIQRMDQTDIPLMSREELDWWGKFTTKYVVPIHECATREAVKGSTPPVAASPPRFLGVAVVSFASPEEITAKPWWPAYQSTMYLSGRVGELIARSRRPLPEIVVNAKTDYRNCSPDTRETYLQAVQRILDRPE